MKLILLVSMAAGLALAGCKKDTFGKDCPAPTVSLAGKPFEGMKYGLGVHSKAGGYSVVLFNHDGTECESLLGRSRMVPPGELSVTASADGAMGDSLYFEGNTQIGGSVKAKVMKKPAKVGDPLAICVSGELALIVGDQKNQKLKAEGLFEGKYCGERE